jgi:hypothetical protein
MNTNNKLLKETKHGQHKLSYYQENKQKFLLAKQKYRAKLKANKPAKLPSPFQQTKQIQLLKLLVNQKSFVPVPQKLKHPIIKNWNADNYWYKSKLDKDNLPRGCVRIHQDNWNNCYIGWLDIDQKGWTKIAKKLRCGYVKSPKGHIRIPVPVRSLGGLKTGTLYYQGEKIGDAKLTGEVMLPGNAYYDKEGKFLGYYEYKAWGTFFPLNNRIWKNTGEFFEILKQDFGIEYKTIREHFFVQKIKQKVLMGDEFLFKDKSFISVKGPPWQKLGLTPQKIVSENRY